MERSDVRLRDNFGNDLGTVHLGGAGVSYTPIEILHAVTQPKDWGPWRLNLNDMTLEVDHYYVDLDECRSPIKALEAIANIAHKSWADNDALAGFVRAMEQIFRMQYITQTGNRGAKAIPERELREFVGGLALERAEGFRIYPELKHQE